MPSEPKTVRVRIPVAVQPNGEWFVPTWTDDDVTEDATRRLDRDWGGFLDGQFRVVWIEADIPLPTETTIQGVVSDA